MPEKAGAAEGLLSGERMIYAAGGRLWVNDKRVMELKSSGPKKLIAMGAYVMMNNPRRPRKEDVMDIYRAIYHRP